MNDTTQEIFLGYTVADLRPRRRYRPRHRAESNPVVGFLLGLLAIAVVAPLTGAHMAGWL